MAKVKIGKDGSPKLILGGNEITLVTALLSHVALGRTPFGHTAADILIALEQSDVDVDSISEEVNLGVTVTKIHADIFAEKDKYFSEKTPNIYIQLDLGEGT